MIDCDRKLKMAYFLVFSMKESWQGQNLINICKLHITNKAEGKKNFASKKDMFA